MTIKHTQFKLNNFQTDRNKIDKVVNESISLERELSQQSYFTDTKKNNINNAKKVLPQYNRFRKYETEWETINQSYSTSQDFRPAYYYAYKLWSVNLGNIPEEYIPFIDVQIIWRNSGEVDPFVPVSTQKYHCFEVVENADGTFSTKLYASILFNDNSTSHAGGQKTSNNSSVDAKLLVTFLYPYNLE